MLKRLKQAWKRDRLGVLGVGSAVLAFFVWAAPVPGRGVASAYLYWFTTENKEPMAALLALAVILLLLRRR
jgi:hypothetical protein